MKKFLLGYFIGASIVSFGYNVALKTGLITVNPDFPTIRNVPTARRLHPSAKNATILKLRPDLDTSPVPPAS